MAITHVKNYSQPPYRDDFDETKNYHRILFKPGFAVQARELTQLQTALQAQIDKLGQYNFKDGDRVLNGKLSLNVDYKFAKVVNLDTNLNPVVFNGQTLTAPNGLQALVLKVLEADGTGPLTFYLKYINSGTDGNGDLTVSEFATDDVLQTTLSSGAGASVRVANASSDAGYNVPIVGSGSEVSISEGVYFISGNMVHVPSSSLILERYSNTPSYIIGLSVEELIVNSGTAGHTDLLDNATGTSNETAPGADRYTISTTLIKQNTDLDSRTSNQYIHLATVKNGEVIKKSEDPIEPVIASRFETRTSEESGDYVINPFLLDIKEYYNDGTNDGFLTSAEIIANGDAGDAAAAEAFGKKKIAIGVEPSVAYVEGFRIEKSETQHVTVDKPRDDTTDVLTTDGFNGVLGYGNYILLESGANTDGLPNINAMEKIDLKSDASTVIGSARVRDLTSVIIDSTAKFRLHLFDITLNAGVNFSSVSHIGSTGAGEFNAALAAGDVGKLYDSSDVSLVYSLPDSGIKTLLDTTTGNDTLNVSVYRRKFSVDSVNNDIATIDISTTPRRFSSLDNLLLSKDGVGTIDAETAATLTGPGQITINLAGLSGYTGSSASDLSIIASVEALSIDALSKTKTTSEITDFTFDAQVANFDSTKPIYLTVEIGDTGTRKGAHDVFELVSVVDQNNNDVTDKFTLDDGQRNAFYDIASIKLIPGNALSTTHLATQAEVDNGDLNADGDAASLGDVMNGNTHTVSFNHFNHGSTASGDYFSVDSYSDLEEIQTFDGLNLGDAIDFRPSIGSVADASGASQIGAIPGGLVPGEFNDTGGVLPSTSMLAAVTSATFTYSQYLGRIDKLFLTKEGDYKVIKGVSSRYPEPPENINDAIHLYTFNLNPYVFGLQDIVPEVEEHRRYTMRDIGDIDARVKNLEYYTSLSLLESSAAAAQIPDTTAGTNRYKNGFIVDGFFGHNIGDSTHPDYAVSIDKENGILRPQFDERNINLVRDDTEDGESSTLALARSNDKAYISKAGGLATLPYTEVTEINQPYSSYAEFVNPYNVIIWDGVLDLDPESDEWKEVDQRPDVIINDDSQYDQFAKMAKATGILGTVWNEWEVHWTGRKTTKAKHRYVTKARTGSWGRRGRRRRGTSHIERLTGTVNRRNKRLAIVDRVTSTTTTTTTLKRTGIQTTLGHNIHRKSLGNKLIETNFIPFMRSRKVYFKAELMKPNTKVYAFFNDVNVTSFCQNLINTSVGQGWNPSNSNGESWPPGHTTYAKRSRANKKYNGYTAPGAVTGGTVGELVTDQYGRIYGEFLIPNTSSRRFKCGTKLFKLTDNLQNNDELSSTTAEENYYAKGILETYQRTIVNTKVPKLVRSELSRKRTVTSKTKKVTHQLVKYYDPIAETFAIDTKGGVFTTGVSLFFQKKDSTIPINVSIREVENGYPTQRVIPGCSKNVYPGAINIPTGNAAAGEGDASAETRITWDQPVFLKEGAEYAIVLISNSDIYKVYVAETSKFDLTNAQYRITKQPYNGVFFTSANASTWTAEQNKDLKFKLHRASFDTGNHTLTLVNDNVDEVQLANRPFDVISTSGGSTLLRVNQPNHGMYHRPAVGDAGDTVEGGDGDSGHNVTIAGVTGVADAADNNIVKLAGIPIANINSTHAVFMTELDSYVIKVTGTVDSQFIGNSIGNDTITSTENQLYDLLRLNTSIIEFPECKTTFKHKGIASASSDSSFPISSADVDYQDIIPNTNIEMPQPYVIKGDPNDTDVNSSGSIDIQCTMSTEVENLSPVIDLNRTSVFTIQNRINDPLGSHGHYVARGTAVPSNDVADLDTASGNNLSSAAYVTKEVVLDNPADELDIFVNINRPTGTSVDVYYKTSVDSDADLLELTWTKAIPTNNNGVVPIDDSYNYNEVYYQVAGLDEYSKFVVKIVLRSNNSSYVPTCKDFRAIATT